MAMGGGGFSEEPDNPLLDGFVLGLARREHPRVCFLGTASGDADSYVTRFYRAFVDHDCYPSDLALFNREVADLRRYVLEQDVIYVGGATPRRCWRCGARTASTRSCRTRSPGRRPVRRERRDELLVRGLGDRLLRARPRAARRRPRLHRRQRLPALRRRRARRPIYHRLVAAGFPAGFAADDGVALHFADAEELVEVVASREGARGYRVEQRPDGAAVGSRCPRATSGERQDV